MQYSGTLSLPLTLDVPVDAQCVYTLSFRMPWISIEVVKLKAIYFETSAEVWNVKGKVDGIT